MPAVNFFKCSNHRIKSGDEKAINPDALHLLRHHLSPASSTSRAPGKCSSESIMAGTSRAIVDEGSSSPTDDSSDNFTLILVPPVRAAEAWTANARTNEVETPLQRPGKEVVREESTKAEEHAIII